MEPRSPSPDPPHPASPPDGGDSAPDPGMHLTTIAHEGRFWEVFLEFVDEPGDPDSCRARLCYVPTDRAEHEEPVRTTVIIIEPTQHEAYDAARALDRYHLNAMLRSVT